MPNILFLDKAHPVLERHLEALGFTCTIDTTSPKELVETTLHQYIGVVMRSRFKVDKSFIDKGLNLKFIAREGVGLEHIDVEYASQKGITVLYSPEGSRDTVGEHALGMLLCLMNHLPRAGQQVRQGQWLREPNRATELKGKTVGILGYGNMGSSLAKKLSGFEVKTLAYDKYKSGYSDAFSEESSLERIFEEADILSLHIPYFGENHYFVNEAFLSQFKKDIYLINTARGLVLETEALVAALKSGKVKAAALDVIEYEETSFDKFRLEKLPAAFDYLQAADNVLLTPHIAGWSFESKEKHGLVLARKIEGLLFVDG